MSMDNMLERTDYAVSEVVAALLLISLVIIGISIVSVLLTSGPPPQDIPKASVQIILDSTTDTISFYHAGGDPFNYYTTNFTDSVGNPIDRDKVYISPRNTTTGSLEPKKKWSENPDLYWDYSSVITLTDQTSSEREKGYQIHHLGGTGEYLIKEFGDPLYSDVLVPPTISPFGYLMPRFHTFLRMDLVTILIPSVHLKKRGHITGLLPGKILKLKPVLEIMSLLRFRFLQTPIVRGSLFSIRL